MRPIDLIHRDIVDHPERDDVRREFAQAIASVRSGWSSYIERSLENNYELVELSVELREELLAPFRAFAGVGYCEFRRGFAETLHVELNAFMKHGDALLDLAPILKVVLYRSDTSGSSSHWKDFIPELIECPAFARVRELRFDGEAVFDFVAMRLLFQTNKLTHLLALDQHWNGMPWAKDNERDELDLWNVALENATFRRMIDWGLRSEETGEGFYAPTVSRLVTRRQLGDRRVRQPFGTSGLRTTYDSMNEDSRALENRYGYLPALHATNWTATVLDVLQGKKPDFPAGAKPTEAMYALPPSHEHVDSNW